VKPIKSFNDYRESLRDGREVYYRGRRVEDVTKHQVLSLAVELIGYVYGEGVDEKLREKLFYDDVKLGRISSFYKTPYSGSDLYERFQLTYEVNKSSVIPLPHIGSDAIFALKIVGARMGGEYRRRIEEYADYAARNNLFLAVAQIDVKGDRKLRPSQQRDPDLYVHVVEERSDGIVVRGAKAHTTFSPVANEIIFLPGRALRKGEEEYAVAFSLPVNSKGLKLICRPVMATEAALNPLEGIRVKRRAETETLTILDNVFVPWERVFVYRDVEAASNLALLFALWHRFSALSYRAALAEYLVGLGKLVAEANGIDGEPHIQKDIVDLVSFAEIQKICAKIAAYECVKDEVTGIAIPNPLYTNIGKIFSNENYLNILKSLIDIAGGLTVTAPSGDDYENEELRGYIEKYLSAAVPGSERFKLFLLLREAIVLLGGEESVIHIHAEGSIRASLIEIYRTYNFNEPKKLVEKLVREMEI